MFKNILRLKNKKGFTLVELVVSVLVIGILMLAVGAMFSPVQKIISDNKRNLYADVIAEQITDYIKNRISDANLIEMKFIEDGSTDFLNQDLTQTGPDDADNYSLAVKTSLANKNRIVSAIIIDPSGKIYDVPLVIYDSTHADKIIKSTLYGGKSLSSIMTSYKNTLKVFNDEYYGDYIYNFNLSTLEIPNTLTITAAVRQSPDLYTKSQHDNMAYPIDAVSGCPEDCSDTAHMTTPKVSKEYTSIIHTIIDNSIIINNGHNVNNYAVIFYSHYQYIPPTP